MPNAYTHDKFGKEAFALLLEGGRTACTIRAHRDLFRMGLQGPDFLFYYRPLTSCAANRLGTEVHRMTGTQFFTQAAWALAGLPDRQAGEAYLYGYICHFALDSSCHSYVEHMVRRHGYDHSEMESDFERRLLQGDGLDPLHYLTIDRLKLEKEDVAVMAAVHPGLKYREAAGALADMRRYTHLLLPTSDRKRALLEKGMRAAGQYERLHGVLIRSKAMPQFTETNRELERCYRRAVPLAAQLMENYRAYLAGEAALAEEFDRIFDENEAEMQRYEERENHV